MKDAIDPIEQKRKVLIEINAYIGRIAFSKRAYRRSTFRCSRLYYGGDTRPGGAREILWTLPFSKCKIAQKQYLLTAFDSRPHWSS